MSNNRISIEYIALSEIEEWPTNPKRHDQFTLEDSLNRFGYVRPFVIDESSGRLILGHGILESLLSMKARGECPPDRIEEREGEWYAPVVRGIAFASECDAEAYVLADNQTSVGSDILPVGMWDEALLLSHFSDKDDEFFIGTEFSSATFKNLVDDDVMITDDTDEKFSKPPGDNALTVKIKFYDEDSYEEFLQLTGLNDMRGQFTWDGTNLVQLLRSNRNGQ